MTHLRFEQLSDLAERGAAEHEHVTQCAECRETLRRLRGLLTAAQALPRDIEPPAEVWMALRARVARDGAGSSRRWWHNGWLAAAAGIVLVIGTAIVAGNGPSRAKARPPVVELPVPGALLAVDNNYVGTVAQLRESLESQRGALAPTTVRTVDRALAVIDSAISEARHALASDPANAALVDILSAHYTRKVELLQRATELSSL